MILCRIFKCILVFSVVSLKNFPFGITVFTKRYLSKPYMAFYFNEWIFFYRNTNVDIDASQLR